MFDLCVTRWAKNSTVHFTLLFRLSLKVLKPLNIKYIWRDINRGKNEADQQDQKVHLVILYKYFQSVPCKSQKDKTVCFEK